MSRVGAVGVAALCALAASGASAQRTITPDLQAEGAESQAVGRVQGVPDADHFTLVVRGMSFRVTLSRAAAQERAGLRPGDLVRVRGDLTGPDRIEAEQLTRLE